MTHSRTVHLPTGHLVAEVAAFPIGSEAAFRQGLVALHPDCVGDTGLLWRALEGALVSGFEGLSLDEAVSARDDLWFEDAPPGVAVPLERYLSNLSTRFLEARGPSASRPNSGRSSASAASRSRSTPAPTC